MNLFVYGTLIHPDIYHLVTGTRKAGEQATAEGFEVLGVQGQSFPGMIEKPGFIASGILYRNLTEDELDRLDYYEDDFYVRKAIEITIQSQPGKNELAWAYLVPESNHHVLSREQWDYSDFCKNHLNDFMNGLHRYLK